MTTTMVRGNYLLATYLADQLFVVGDDGDDGNITI